MRRREKAPDPAASELAAAIKHKGKNCTGFPDFVALPPDASVSTCDNGTAAAAHIIGKVVFDTDMAPKDAIAFVRDQARRSGLPEGVSGSNPDAPMYTANDTKTKRSIAVTSERLAVGGTRVTVSWGKENWDVPANATGGQRSDGG